jgi:conserved domain protein|nr:MAG TPA: Cro/C1-type HTH DNA-binding domain protein [Caudoviricetes sp.]
MIKIHLSKLLGERRISQKRLSELTGIRRATINEMYHELIERINLEHLNSICAVLKIDVDELLEYIPDKKIQE